MCRKCINYISPFSGCLHLNHSTANSLQIESLFSLLLTSQNSVSHPSTQSTLSLGRSDHLTLLVSTLHSSLLRRKPYSLAWQAKAWGSNPFVPHYPQNLSSTTLTTLSFPFPHVNTRQLVVLCKCLESHA
jgi:hypothetical protein